MSVTLTTANPNDIIIVSAAYGSCPSPNTPKDTAGLAFQVREKISYCNNVELVESYAIASSALSSDKITCSSASDSWISCAAFGVSGGNTAAPFDPKSPAYTTTGGSVPNCPGYGKSRQILYPCVTSLSTSRANDFVFDIGADTGSQAQTAAAGYTLVADTSTGQDAYIQYKVPTSTLSNDLEPFGQPCGVGFVVIGDAIQPAASGATSSTSSTTTSSKSVTSTTSDKTSETTTSTSTLQGKRLGFWVAEDDMWSGEPGLDWTPQQFVSNYFLTPPYPSAMLFATGLEPTGANAVTVVQEAQWLGQVASIAQAQGLNVEILLMIFVNLSGQTVYKGSASYPDQTQNLTDFMQALKGHSNIYGAQYEEEYFGNTLAEQTTFKKIVTAAGYVDIGGPGVGVVLDYSPYPYYGGVIYTSLSSQYIGVGYGEVGAPPAGIPQEWNQTTVQAIIDTSAGNPYVFIFASFGGTGQPTYRLWNWPTLLGWIWSDPNYQDNYILSNTDPTSGGYSSQDVAFSSLDGYSYLAGPNFGTAGNTIQVQVPRTMTINMVNLLLSDRAYDPYNETLYFEDGVGTVLATGTLSEWGPYGLTGDGLSPLQLSQVITLQANTPYKMVFSSLPSEDTYRVSQDVWQTTVLIPGTGYLGQTTWPIFQLGLMDFFPMSSGLSNHNYGAYTDLFSSPGYQGTSEIAMRFMTSQTEQLTSFEVYAISSDGSSNKLVFTLRSDTNGQPTPLATAPALATASVTAAQVKANLTSHQVEPTGQGTFVKVKFSNAQLQSGTYYWIVMASPSGMQSVVLGRLVNPYRAYVLESSNDFQTRAGVPADGPSDLGFRVTTTGESIINTISDFPKNNGFASIAQSFTPTKTATIKGLWAEIGLNAGSTLTISIESAGVSDSPSGTILTQAVTTGGPAWSYYGSGGVYVTFGSEVTLNAGAKYWLVFQTSCNPAVGSCSSPDHAYALEYRSDMYNTAHDFGGQANHFEYNTGSGWTADSALGDMNFQLVGPTGYETSNTTTTTGLGTCGITTTTTTSTTTTTTASGSPNSFTG